MLIDPISLVLLFYFINLLEDYIDIILSVYFLNFLRRICRMKFRIIKPKPAVEKFQVSNIIE